jgi:hypothetical protein
MLPVVTGKAVPALPPPAAQRRAGVGRDCLKINYAQMKNRFTNEFLTKCWLAVRASERWPLSEAEQHFYTAIHLAVMAYEDEVRFGHPPTERRCMICEKPLSECNC